MIFPIILLLIPVVKYIFIFAGHPQNQIDQKYTYFAFLMIGALQLLIRNALAGFFLGIGETKRCSYDMLDSITMIGLGVTVTTRIYIHTG